MSQPTQLPAVVAKARALYDQGDPDGARRLLEYTLEGARPAYGAWHPDVLQMGRLLAALYREAGDVSSARRVLEEALAAGQLQWPEDDPLMLLLAYDLGVVANEFGNRHVARRNLEQVVRFGPGVLGATHPVVRAAGALLDPESTQSLPTLDPLIEQPLAPPLPRPGRRRRRRRRTHWMILLLIVAVATAAVVFFTSGRATPAPGPSSPEPSGVRLVDRRTDITLTWDGLSSEVSVIVTGGQSGEQSRPFAPLVPGRTSYTVYGLNPTLEYCFAVVAVYADNRLAPSALICTNRAATTDNPQPAPTS